MSAAELRSAFSPTYGDPFGGRGATQTGFGFTGEVTDASGLVYLRTRYYNPTIGQFFNLDPFEGWMGQPSSLNRYPYVQGNVSNMIDPSGLCAGDPCNISDPNRDISCWEKAIALYQDYGAVIGGTWTYNQVALLYEAMDVIARKIGDGNVATGRASFRATLGQLHPTYWIQDRILVNLGREIGIGGQTPAFTDPFNEHHIFIEKGVLFAPNTPIGFITDTFIHELGHFIHFSSAEGFAVNTFNNGVLRDYMNWVRASCAGDIVGAACVNNSYNPGKESAVSSYGASAPWEDFATAWSSFIEEPMPYGATLNPDTQPLRYSFMLALVARMRFRSAGTFSKSDGWTKFYGCKTPLS